MFRASRVVRRCQALLNTHKITGLNMSRGTKLLYFAGYTTDHRPRPLVLDERVRAALDEIAPGTVPPKGRAKHADYLRYLELAETWASDLTWNQHPDVVEYALFSHETTLSEGQPREKRGKGSVRRKEALRPLSPTCNLELPANGRCEDCN